MQNFLNSRKKISGESLPRDAQRISEGNAGLSKVEVVGNKAGESKIELLAEDGVIRSIIINCKCGERIELKCHY